MTAKEKIERYLSLNKIRQNRFYGKCILTDNGALVLGDILSKEEGNLLLREDGDRLQIFIGKESIFFEPGNFYEFSIRITDNYKTGEPFIGLDTRINLPKLLIENPYKEIVRLRYERLDNPEANKMIANLMREIGKGLYSSKQRMIFELLQNADDTPAGEEISFHIDAHSDYLLFMHNGLPFNQDDVEAITSAAESTKRHDRKKTGYKGIGFKSVFTDSYEVIIKSGSFLFAFKRNHEAFLDFDSFYFSKKRYLDYPDLLEEDRQKFARQRRTFNGQTDIPWQLIPIWYDSLPKELRRSKLAEYNNNVGFAIRFGKHKVGEYLDAVANFAESPHFMLFLRHIKTFKSLQNGITIRKSGKNLVKIERSALDGDILNLTYFKTDFDDIGVNDASIHAEGILIYKGQKENQYGEITHYFSYDPEGENIIESIPPKLASFDVTTITLAAPVIANMICAEPFYLEGKNISSFYTFLPMKEMRISLPFMVNADFVPDASREKLQGDNEWNEYIISKIAYYHLRWLSDIADASIEQDIYQTEYLSLLLKDLLPDDFSIKQLIARYNQVYQQAVGEVRFIISDQKKLCLTSEIILDRTGIAEILGSDLFYKLSNTKKYLPYWEINASYLLYDYLKIECFTFNEFTKALTNEKNVFLFSGVIKTLDTDQYKQFLSWLDSYFKISELGSELLLSLPFIRVKEEVISISEALKKSDFHFRNSQTIKIEGMLTKIGFETSEFSIEDTGIEHIMQIILKQDSYLKSEKLLYEHIISAPLLKLLIPEEKNTLLQFFENLKEIGPAKFAKTLALFKSNNPSSGLKPLNSLISNEVKNLPEWLTHFTIDTNEEKSLSEQFKKLLLHEKDLLQKLFCNVETFSEIATRINSNNIGGFYTYFLKLYKEKPKEIVIDLLSIPCVFIESSATFGLASTVYWPDSITKLSATQYTSVKTILETLSGEKLPHFSALQIKAPFALGGNDFKLSALIPKEISFNVITVNDFLDWAQTNGETDLLNHFSFSSAEEKISITKVEDTFSYYTTDDTLISFIKASTLNTRLNLFPKELYSRERSKLGLLEGVSLLKYMIENGLTTTALAKFIKSADDTSLTQQYLELLTVLYIDTTKTYTSENAEFITLKLVVKHIIADKEKLKNFKKIITIDGHPLLERAISEDVFFYDKNIGIKTKLSEILSAYKNRTFPLSEIIAKFENFNDNANLVAILKDEGRTPKKILKELTDLKVDYYNPAQTFFLSFYQNQYPEESVLKNKVLFTNANSDNPIKFKSEMHEFLDICLKENSYVAFVEQGIIPSFSPINLVSTEEYAIDSEKLPVWLKSWSEAGEIVNKRIYLKSLRINDEKSAVVLYRKAIREVEEEAMNTNLENVKDMQMLIQTLEWIANERKAGRIGATGTTILKPLYQKLSNNKVLVEKLLFPSLIAYGKDDYDLVALAAGEEVHYMHEGWREYKSVIFKQLIKTSKVTDDVLTKEYRTAWEVKEGKPTELPDAEKLKSESDPFEEDYYLTWPEKAKCKISVYRGRLLPYLIQYYNHTIAQFEKNITVFVEGVYYIAASKKDFAISYFEDTIERNLLNNLKAHQATYKAKQKKEEREVHFTPEETETLKKLFGNEIPEEYFKDLNLAACVTALVKLSQKGYDVDKADSNLFNTHGFAQITPVYESGNSVPLTIMCRSAKSGILYLTAKAWNRLDQSDVRLFVKTGNQDNDYHFFQDKTAVMEVSDTPYQVFRVEASSGSETTDAIINGRFSKDKIWLILKMKEKTDYESIFEGGIRWNENNPDYDNLQTDEDLNY